AAILQISTAGRHKLHETPLVAALHETLDALGGGPQRLEGGAAEVVQSLDLEVEMRVIASNESGNSQLLVERGARHLLQPRHELAALGERREEGEVERMGQPEHVGHEAIVLVQ